MRLFRIACYILLITGVSHLAWHFYLSPQFRLKTRDAFPVNSLEEKLLEMMNDYHRNVAGTDISFMDVQLGFSLLYSIFLIWMGVLNLVLVKPVRRNHRLLAKVSLINAGVLLTGAAITIVYFFWLPFLCFLLAAFFFGGAGFLFSRSRQF